MINCPRWVAGSFIIYGLLYLAYIQRQNKVSDHRPDFFTSDLEKPYRERTEKWEWLASNFHSDIYNSNLIPEHVLVESSKLSSM